MVLRAAWLPAAAFVALALLLGACGGGGDEEVQAPWPSPTPVAHPVTLADVHCFTCHDPSSPTFAPLSSGATHEAMPHPLEQREDCLVCHATRAPYPFSQSHDLALNQACLICHTPPEIR